MFWLGAIVSLCYVPGTTGAYIATQWPVLAVLMMFGLLRSGPFTIFHGLGLLFVAYATAHAWFTPAQEFSVFGLWLVWIMALSVWFGTTLVSTRELYAGLALGAGVSSAVAVLQHFGLNAIPRASDAPAGIYVNGVQQGIVLALLVVALLTERMWFWALPLLPGIALSGSRGAWFALAVGLTGLAVRRTWLLGIAAAVVVLYLLMPLSMSDQLRMLIWTAAWHNLTPFGWGPGTFYAVLLPQNGGGSFFPEYAHNDALQLAFEYGIGAAPVFVIFAFALGRTHVREWPVILTFVTAGFYSMPLWMPLASFLVLVGLGHSLRAHALVRGERDRCGRHVLSWRRCGEDAGCGAVPVQPSY